MAPHLFSLEGGDHVRRFVERVLRVRCVNAVQVSFHRGAADLEYDTSATTGTKLLTQLACALTNSAVDKETPSYSCIDLRPRTRSPAIVRCEKLRTPWEVSEVKPGWVQVRNQQLCRHRRFARPLAQKLEEASDVLHAAAHWGRASIVIRHNTRAMDRGRLVQRLKTTAEHLNEQQWARLQAGAGGAALAQGTRRTVYRILGVSNFAMTIFAVIMPGIPTPPFLFATAFFTMRSSPSLKVWLEGSRMFGRMIHDWRHHRALRTSVKAKSISITLAVVALGTVLLNLSGLTLTIVLSMTALEIVTILLLPRLPWLPASNGHDARRTGESIRVAIVAP
jgi:uncharacterized membrane protein YbaN (DUF454 family)